MIKANWSLLPNFGDTLTPHILKHFLGEEVEYANRDTQGKLLGVGSIMVWLRNNDIVFGTGVMEPGKEYSAENVTVLATRGPVSRQAIKTNKEIPEIYGDPALLLPLMYDPEVKPIYEVGYIPHYVDQKIVKSQHDFEKENSLFIDLRCDNVMNDWKQIVDQAKLCKKIVSSSLHGVILGESYGIPTVWIEYSDKIIGGEYKFQDYFLGTGRERQKTNVVLPPIPDLKGIQDSLLASLYLYYGNHKKTQEL